MSLATALESPLGDASGQLEPRGPNENPLYSNIVELFLGEKRRERERKKNIERWGSKEKKKEEKEKKRKKEEASSH